jgi:hypothetical protein
VTWRKRAADALLVGCSGPGGARWAGGRLSGWACWCCFSRSGWWRTRRGGCSARRLPPAWCCSSPRWNAGSLVLIRGAGCGCGRAHDRHRDRDPRRCRLGPVLPLASVVVLSRLLRVAGADCWRPVAVQGAAASVGLYLATAAGWLPTVLTGGQALVVWAVVACLQPAHRCSTDVERARADSGGDRAAAQRATFPGTRTSTGPDGQHHGRGRAFGRLTYVDPAEGG